MTGPPPSQSVTNILIVGVGGQGVIMVSRVLAELSGRAGFEVKQSEIHGMAKRGGGIFSHLRFGEQVFSPTIANGEADILLALEWAEGLRWLNFLKPGGAFIASTHEIMPPYAFRDRRRGALSAYQPTSADEIMARMETGFALDALEMAKELGNQRVANTILLGVLSRVLDFAEADWLDVLSSLVPPKTVALNHQAFALGQGWQPEARDNTPGIAKNAPLWQGDEGRAPGLAWEITGSWCKGCDICVKMCPERCLALGGDQVALLTDPHACTGCRICEWLCPDFAISMPASPNYRSTFADQSAERVSA